MPFVSFVGTFHRNPERSSDRVILSSRELRRQLGGLFRRHPGGEHFCPVAQQRLENPLQGGHRFPLGEDHFRKTAAAVPIQVDLGVAHVGDRRPAGPVDKLLDRQLARQQPGSQLFQFVGAHDPIVSRIGGGVNSGVTVQGLAGDWSIFRREDAFLG